jgi:hypothetical protein
MGVDSHLAVVDLGRAVYHLVQVIHFPFAVETLLLKAVVLSENIDLLLVFIRFVQSSSGTLFSNGDA